MAEERTYTEQEIYDQTNQLAKYWEGTHDEAEWEIGRMGFQRIRQPEFTCPVLNPQTLTTTNLGDYSQMHARFQRWHNYAENTLAYVKSMLVGNARQMKQLVAQLKILYAGYKNPVTGKPYSADDRQLFVENNPRYVELLRSQTKLEQMKIQMESYAEGLSKDAALVSRHIELRKMDMEGDHRGHNMPSRGLYQQ
jgi:hypothetical protein